LGDVTAAAPFDTNLVQRGARNRRTPYYEATQRYAPKGFTVYNHMYFPIRFDTFEAEFDALLNAVTIWDVAVERCLEISGPDGFRFAQLLTPRDLSKCAVGQAKYVLICDSDGGIVNDPVVLHVDENVWWMQLADSDAGLYTLAATTVRWDVIHADGTAGGTQTIDYAAGVQNQYSVASLCNTTLQDNDVLVATVLKGSAIFYGSVINQASGDPSFVPGIRTRAQSNVTLLGVDRDENGSIDIAAHDNILDRTVDVTTFGFPAFFRIVSDQPVTYEIISSTADARLIDQNGTIQMVASAALSGGTGEIKVRATTTDGLSTVFTIPVRFL